MLENEELSDEPESTESPKPAPPPEPTFEPEVPFEAEADFEPMPKDLLPAKQSESEIVKVNELTRFHLGLKPNYVGLRYGFFVPRNQVTLLSKTNMYGFLVDWSVASALGIRVSFDQVPTVTERVSGETLKFGWQRVTLGMPVMWRPWFFFDRLHIAPKIGSYTLSARIPIGHNDGRILVEEFNLNRAFSVGYEFDLERDLQWFHTRMWFGHDIAGAMHFIKSDTTIYTKKTGVDVIIDSPLKLNTHPISFLFFGLVENHVFVKRSSQDGDTTVDIMNNYIGSGIMLNF